MTVAPAALAPVASLAPAAPPRLLCPRPAEVLVQGTLDQLLPPDHPARNVRAFAATLDLTELLDSVRSLEGKAGRPAIDPRLLLELWLFATACGVASARQLAELCKEHLAYRWLAGGVGVEYRTLSDFRTGSGELLDRLLGDTVAVMLHEGLIELNRVAQDGLRVRACAGSSSFRRGETLQRCREEARQQVEALRQGQGEDQGAPGRRAAAAQVRAARERAERVAAAQEALAELRRVNDARPPSQKKKDSQLRASTTDPQSRRMKMADGGVRPAYNFQFATTTKGGAIVGVAVSDEGTDGAQLEPMLERIEARHGVRPQEVLADGGYVTVEGIDEAERKGTRVYAPIKSEQKQLKRGEDPYARKKTDTEVTAVWRARMGTEQAKAIYRQRGQTAEWVNAGARNRGLYRLSVRGQAKALAVALWQALVHNMAVLARLRAAVRSAAAAA